MFKKTVTFLNLQAAAMIWLSSVTISMAQEGQTNVIPLTDLSFARNPGKTWQLAADVNADLNKENVLSTSKGAGVLVNVVDNKNHGTDLYTTAEHGDVQLELAPCPYVEGRC